MKVMMPILTKYFSAGKKQMLEKMATDIPKIEKQNEEMAAKQMKVMMPILTKYFSAGKKQMLETTYNAWRHFVATIRQEAEMYAVLKKRQDEAARLTKKVKQAGKIHAT